jgi:hypothetical protein
VEPEITVTMGVGKTGRPKPSALMRLTEMAGMAIIFWGLGMGPWWLIAVGGVMVVASYAAYRRKHGPFPPGEGRLDGMGDDGGGD